MKKILPLLVLSLFVFPVFAGAHVGSDVDDPETRFEMMEHMEDRVLGDELHEEMENLMIKMMNGELSKKEIDRLTELMQQYPGPHGMMMNRMYGNFYKSSDWNNQNNMGWGMHSGFGSWFNSGWIMFLGNLIWIIAGIVLIVFLGRRMGDN